MIPRIRKCEEVVGENLRFRNAEIEDASFIVSLRQDERLNRYLSPTSPDVEDQKRWLTAYASDDSQAYFIIEAGEGASVGTVRLYDARGDSFCWGSWILSDKTPRSGAIESTLMVYHYGFFLGFNGAHFDVRKGNEKVWQYHERLGAVRTHEDELNYFYRIDRSAIEKAFEHYSSRLPRGVKVGRIL